MNIEYIANIRLPTERAHGLQIMSTCRGFVRAGAQVRLWIPRKMHRALGSSDPFEFYGMHKSFDINRLRCVDLLGFSERFGAILYWVDALSFLFALCFARIPRDSVVYVRDPLFLLPISRARHTLCAEVHNVPERGHVFFSLLDRAHRIVVISNGLRSVLTQNGIDPAKIFVVPDGVDADEFEIDVSREKAREMVGLPVGARIVLYTGHLYEWKGAGTFARAAALLPEALFVCVGGIEPEFSAFRDGHASVLNLKIIPFQHHSRIPLYLRAADVLVLPNSGRETISARYTSPLKLFEYMASGTPIVASDLPSMREILNERNSFFAIADDPKSFSAAIRVVLLDDTAGNRAKVAQKQARTYDWDARARRIMDSLRLLRHV